MTASEGLDFDDPAIRRMVGRHEPMENREVTCDGLGKQLRVTVFVACNVDGQPWPCGPVRALRAWEADQ